MSIEIYEDKHDEWRWRMRAGNGKIVGDSGEGYATKWNATLAARRFLKSGLPIVVVRSDD